MSKHNNAADRTQAGNGKRLRATSSPSQANDQLTKKQRKPSRTGVDTRSKLLDAAELMFANQGFDGTSLRDIANAARLHLALSSYHFGTKERLFEEVIRRRALEMEEKRLSGLFKIQVDSQSATETVRALIEAYVSPMIQARYGHSRQWQAHVRLMASLVNIKRWTPLIRKHYDRCAHMFIERWQEVLPGVDKNALFNAFSFMVVTMLYVCSYTDRFEKWKKRSPSHKKELAEVTEDLVRFVHAGFMSLVQSKTRG
jgi:AcrR family transcriptional regulator